MYQGKPSNHLSQYPCAILWPYLSLSLSFFLSLSFLYLSPHIYIFIYHIFLYLYFYLSLSFPFFLLFYSFCYTYILSLKSHVSPFLSPRSLLALILKVCMCNLCTYICVICKCFKSQVHHSYSVVSDRYLHILLIIWLFIFRFVNANSTNT